jgi:uncharacterized repeat protein (TIGR01451 family)
MNVKKNKVNFWKSNKLAIFVVSGFIIFSSILGVAYSLVRNENLDIAQAATEPTCQTVATTPSWNPYPLQTNFPNPVVTSGNCRDMPLLSFFPIDTNAGNPRERNILSTQTFDYHIYYNNGATPGSAAINNPRVNVQFTQVSPTRYRIAATLTGNNAQTVTSAQKGGDLFVNVPAGTQFDIVARNTNHFPDAIERREETDTTGRQPNDLINDNTVGNNVSNPIYTQFLTKNLAATNGFQVKPSLEAGFLGYGYILTKISAITPANTNAPQLVISKSAETNQGVNIPNGTLLQRGQEFNYRLTFANIGNRAATGVIITDTLDSKLEYVSCTVPNSNRFTCGFENGQVVIRLNSNLVLAANSGELDATFRVRVREGANIIGNVLNQAIIDSEQTEPTPSNETTHPLANPQTQLSIAKSANPTSGSQVQRGQRIDYTLNVGNIGAAAANNLVITDVLDSNLTYVAGSCASNTTGVTCNYNANTRTITWNRANLAVGAQINLTFGATVNNNTPISAVIRNQGRADASNTEEVISNETVHTVIDPNTVLSITKSANPPTGSEVQRGQNIAYTVSVRNAGNLVANNLVITDVLDQNLTYVAGSCASDLNAVTCNYNANTRTITWNRANLAVNERINATFNATVNSNTAAGTQIRNQARADASNTPEVISNQTVHTVADPIPQNPDLQIRKTIQGNPAFVTRDQRVTYILEFRNVGGGESINTIIRDTLDADSTYVDGTCTTAGLPAGATCNHANGIITWNVGTLPANQTGFLTVRYDVTINSNAGGSINNIVRITSDNDPTGDQDEQNVPVFIENANLQIDKAVTSDRNNIIPGSTIDYRLQFRNVGNGPANQTIIRDFLDPDVTYVNGTCTTVGLPAGATCNHANGIITWNVGTLPANMVDFLSVNYQVTVNPGVEGTIDNIAIITSPDDPTGDEDEESVNVLVQRANLVIDKSISGNPAIVQRGDTVNYQLDFRNTGNRIASQVTIVDFLDPDVTYVNGSCTTASLPVGATCSHSNGVITWSGFDLPANMVQNLSVTYSVIVNANANGTIRNLVQISSPDDPNGDQDETDVPVFVPRAALQIRKSTADNIDTVAPGDTVEYVLEYRNVGDLNARETTIRDFLDPNVAYVDGSCTVAGIIGATCNHENGIITWNLGITPANQVEFTRLTYSVVVSDEAAGTIDNLAIITSLDDPTGDEDDETVLVLIPNVFLRIDKEADVTTTQPGNTINYTLRFRNLGNNPATNVEIRDFLDVDSTYVEASCTLPNPEIANSTCGQTSPNSGILVWNIPTLEARSQEYSVTYQVTVNQDARGVIRNIVRITSPQDPDGDQDEEVVAIENPTSSSSSSDSSQTSSVSSSDSSQSNSDSSSSTSSLSSSSDSSISSSSDSSESSLSESSSSSISSSVSSSQSSSAPEQGSVEITKNVDVGNGTIVRRGDTLNYTITVRNNSNVPVFINSINDTIDSDLEFISCSPVCARASSQNSNGNVEESISWAVNTNLNPNETVILNFVARVRPTAVGEARNFATVIFDPTNPNNPTNPNPRNQNSNVVVNPIGNDLGIDKTNNDGDGNVNIGQTVRFTLAYTNFSQITQTNVVITDILPAGLTFVAGSCTPDCTITGNTITWTIATLAPGARGQVTFDATVNNGVSGSITNIGRIRSTQNPNDLQDTDTVNIANGIIIGGTPRTGGIQFIALGSSLLLPITAFAIHHRNQRQKIKRGF